MKAGSRLNQRSVAAIRRCVIPGFQINAIADFGRQHGTAVAVASQCADDTGPAIDLDPGEQIAKQHGATLPHGAFCHFMRCSWINGARAINDRKKRGLSFGFATTLTRVATLGPTVDWHAGQADQAGDRPANPSIGHGPAFFG